MGQITQFGVFGIVAMLNTYFTVQDLQITFENEYPPTGEEIGTRVNFGYSYTHSCKGSLWILAVSIAVNITILSLFLNFFSKNYSKPKPGTNKPNQKSKKQKRK